jgi:hypothetical protein
MFRQPIVALSGAVELQIELEPGPSGRILQTEKTTKLAFFAVLRDPII